MYSRGFHAVQQSTITLPIRPLKKFAILYSSELIAPLMPWLME